MKKILLGIRVTKDIHKKYLEMKSKERENDLYASDIYISDQVIQLGMREYMKGERI